MDDASPTAAATTTAAAAPTAPQGGTRRLEYLLTATCFGLLLVGPWLAGALGVRASESTENRPLLPAPSVELERLLDTEQFSEIEAFLTDHLPLRQESAAIVNKGMYAATGESPVESAFVDRSGTWTLSDDYLDPCVGEFRPDDLATTIAGWEDTSEGTTDMILLVAPDKSVIVDDQPGYRNRVADSCQVKRELQLVESFAGTGNLIDLWTPLRQRVQGGDRTTVYFTNDSHWTFDGATALSKALVDSLAPGIYDPAAIVPVEQVTVTGDVTRRLGWEYEESVDRLRSDRPGVTTELAIEETGWPQGVRVHRSEGRDLIAGRTIVVHDSMMNYAEAVLAPYFEHIEFVHWNDLVDADGVGRAADADRIIFEFVQRDMSARTRDPLLRPDFDDALRAALLPR